MDSFRYDPIDLDGCAFRLLQLCYGSEGPIECHLFDASLDYTIEYEALSYTWGSSEQFYEISLNDIPIPVTVNLSRALWDLRYPDRDRILWVDAICINQEDVKERGHQVKQMASIYKNAEQVVVWLGRPNLDTSSVFRHMRKLEKIATEHAYHEWEVSDRRWQKLWSTAKPMVDAETTTWLLQQRRGLESILRHQWFTRVWIIQEIANARSATIMCGTLTVSSRIFAAMPSLVGITMDPHCQAIFDVMPGPLRKHSWWAKRRDLRTLLLKFRWSKASDSRDVIYALLGISSDARNSEYLLPNYELSEEEVVRDTLAFLLSFNDLGSSTPSLPQWTLLDFTQSLESLGNRVLQWSVESGKVALTYHLLGLQASGKEQLEFNGEKLFRSAAYNGHTTIARLLQDTGIFNINRRDQKGRTMLSRAVIEGDENLLRITLETDRAEVDAEDSHGETALTLAVQNNRSAIVEMLLRKKATGDRDGIITSILREFASHGGQSAAIKLFLESPSVAESQQKFYQTHLLKAAKERVECEMELLVDFEETDIITKNVEGSTSLLLAENNEHENIVKLRLDPGKTDLCAPNKRWFTPFIAAFTYADSKMVGVLLNSGLFNPNEDTGHEQTPLMCAVKRRRTALIEVLLSAPDVEVDAEDRAGNTPLFWAVKNGEKGIVHQLLQSNKANVNHKNRVGDTPLSWLQNELAKRNDRSETKRNDRAEKGTLHELLQSIRADDNDKDQLKDGPLSSVKKEHAKGDAPLSSVKKEQAEGDDCADILGMLLEKDKAEANVTTGDFRQSQFTGAWRIIIRKKNEPHSSPGGTSSTSYA
jgi:ankyrin repeat protein